MNKDTTLAHYTILKPLGKGGMGEVYLAHDTKLDRQVAIKVLPETLHNDSERLARFRREAKAAASLKHNNIATIYSLEEAEDVLFIVMEYVEGETLADMIPPDGLDVGGPDGSKGVSQYAPTFFDIFIPLADALAHAHENGRVHRDLKPANIMITEDGTPKILDFGLAQIFRTPHSAFRTPEVDTQTETKSMDPADLNKQVKPPSDPSAMSPGPKLMGTPAYMSPEQAEAQPLDHRTDIFSFGVVMYEALTGQKAFEGTSRTSLLGRFVNEHPEPVTGIKPVTPHSLWEVIRRSIRKNRNRRTQTAHELHDDLLDVHQEIQSGTVLIDATNPSIRQSVNPSILSRPIYAVTFALLLAILTATFAWLLKPSPTPESRLRLFNLPLEATVGTLDGPVLSPDGKMVVYMKGIDADRRLWVRYLDQTEPRELSTTEGGGRPFFSPDNRHIGYFENTGSLESATLRTVSTEGGPTTPVCVLPGSSFPRGAVWTPDGRIIFSMSRNFQDPGSGSLYSVSAGGGTPELFLAPDTTAGEQGIIYPMLLPDGITLVASITLEDSVGTLTAISGDQRFSLVRHPGDVLAYPAYAPSGHLVYQRGFGGVFGDRVSTSVWAAGFDPDDPSAAGEPFLVADKTQTPGVSSDGTLLYSASGDVIRNRNRLVWVDRSGQVTGTIGQEQPGLGDPALSPDERRVAVSAIDHQGNMDIWVHDVSRGTAQRLTYDPTLDGAPVWSPDGESLVFGSMGNIGGELNTYVVPSNGSGSVEPLILGQELIFQHVTDWSSDNYVLYTGGQFDSTDLWFFPLTGDKAPVQLTDTPYNEGFPRLSPDGRYVAYHSDESGRQEVSVTRFPSGEGKWQVSVEGGANPRWSRKGDELFFIAGNTLMAAPVRSGASFEPGTPRTLFSGDGVTPPLQMNSYDVSRDGRRFVMVQQVEAGEQPASVVTLVQDWVEGRLTP